MNIDKAILNCEDTDSQWHFLGSLNIIRHLYFKCKKLKPDWKFTIKAYDKIQAEM